jgi:hypothetical protein
MNATVELEQITSTLSFTPEELTLNRTGRLSSRQFWRVIRYALFFGPFAIIMPIFMAAMVNNVWHTGFVRVCFYGLVALCVSAGAVFAGWKSVKGAITRTVIGAEGLVKIDRTGKGAVANVGSASVPINWMANNVLQKGRRYRLFYVRDILLFLSIEPLPEEGDSEAAPP